MKRFAFKLEENNHTINLQEYVEFSTITVVKLLYKPFSTSSISGAVTIKVNNYTGSTYFDNDGKTARGLLTVPFLSNEVVTYVNILSNEHNFNSYDRLTTLTLTISVYEDSVLVPTSHFNSSPMLIELEFN